MRVRSRRTLTPTLRALRYTPPLPKGEGFKSGIQQPFQLRGTRKLGRACVAAPARIEAGFDALQGFGARSVRIGRVAGGVGLGVSHPLLQLFGVRAKFVPV